MELEIPLVDKQFGLQNGNSNQEALFLAFLLGLTRAGYFCYDAKYKFPSPEMVYGELLPDPSPFVEVLSAGITSPLVIREGDAFYLKRIYEARQLVFREWKRLSKIFTCPVPVDGSLTEEQQSALDGALTSTPFILTGGPGTGKTYTASRILAAMPSLHAMRVAMAAPTGKAALHLEKNLRSKVDFNGEAMTLHRLCLKSEGMLPYDLYFIDEAAMIDLELMARFLPKVRTGARLILLGDANQLPPVECGSPFKELCEKSPYVSHLTFCQRAELKELVECGRELLKSGTFLASNAVELYPEGAFDLDALLCRFPQSAEVFSPGLLEAFNRFRLLSPLRKGPIGVDAINRQILQKLWKARSGPLFPVPIQITSNEPSLGLFNGETALLMTGHSPFETPKVDDKVYFADGRVLPALLLPHYELAYCITVHKSQGSEFDHVALLLGQDPLSKKRELLYTAATRAKKKLSVYNFD